MLPLRRARAVLVLACVVSPAACSPASDASATGASATQTDPGTTDAPDAGTGTTAAATTSAGTSTADSPTTAAADDATGTTADANADTSTGAPACGAGGIDDCCCFGVEGQPGHEILAIGCVGDAAACAAPQATCPEDQVECGAAELEVTSADGLDCVLEALAQRQPGVVSWGIGGAGGLTGSSHTLFVQADGTAFVSSYTYDDVGYAYTAVERRALQPAAFFGDCAAQDAEADRFDCLQHATADAATETCVDGFEGTIGRR